MDQGEVKAGDLKGLWFSYSMEPQGIQSTLVHYIFPKNGMAYALAAGTQTKDAAGYRKLFDSVARSLRFE